MPRELYNEGRVVGYSAYELYVKHALSEFPDDEPASEREWLAAQLGHGSSLILRIPIEESNITGTHHLDVSLPENSELIAASTIIGSQFFGNCKFDSDNESSLAWATRVIDYGQGISNTQESSPETSEDANAYPSQTASPFYANDDQLPETLNPEGDYEGTYSQNTDTQFLQYLKIQDAVILQPGIWQDAGAQGEPDKDFIPNYHNRPILRITLASRITTEFYILLTGFTNRSIVAGITGIDQGSTQEINPENGDFLGPELYPWANKVIFMTPPVSTYFRHKYLASGHENRRDIVSTETGYPKEALTAIDATSAFANEDGSRDASTVYDRETKLYIVRNISGTRSSTFKAGTSYIVEIPEKYSDIGEKIHVLFTPTEDIPLVTQASDADGEEIISPTYPNYLEINWPLIIEDNSGQIIGCEGNWVATPDKSSQADGQKPSSGKINFIWLFNFDTSPNSTREDNLRIDHDENDVNTIFTSSYLYSADGVSLEGPATPGGDISIGAKVGSVGLGQNYIKVTQTHSDYQHKQVTDLEHSDIVPGLGIAYHAPSVPGEDVKFSSMIAPANNYLKVEQVAKQNLSDGSKVNATKQSGFLKSTELSSPEYGYTTLLTPSKFVGTSSSNGSVYITIEEPTNPGEDVKISLNWSKLLEDLSTDPTFRKNMLGSLWASINQILKKIGAGGAVASELTSNIPDPPDNADKLNGIDWSGDAIANISDLKIPLGNLNVYSSDNGTDKYIKCHANTQAGDLRVN